MQKITEAENQSQNNAASEQINEDEQSYAKSMYFHIFVSYICHLSVSGPELRSCGRIISNDDLMKFNQS